MRSKEELKLIHPRTFPSNLSVEEQIEWLRIAKPHALEIARVACTEFHGSEVHARVLAEIDRKAKDASEDWRHGEEMTAAAVANSLARQGVCWGKLGFWLAIGSIVLTILIALTQQCQR